MIVGMYYHPTISGYTPEEIIAMVEKDAKRTTLVKQSNIQSLARHWVQWEGIVRDISYWDNVGHEKYWFRIFSGTNHDIQVEMISEDHFFNKQGNIYRLRKGDTIRFQAKIEDVDQGIILLRQGSLVENN